MGELTKHVGRKMPVSKGAKAIPNRRKGKKGRVAVPRMRKGR